MNFDNYTIRLFTQNDSENYFQLVDKNRKRLEDFFAGTVAKTKTPEETKIFIFELILKAQQKTFFPYGIFDSTSQKMIGYIHLMNFDWNLPKAEIGFFIDADYAGKGIMSKAVSTVVSYYFDELGFHKLFLRTHPSNLSAQALAEKCGFEKEGLLRHDYKTTAGQFVDLIYYGKLR